MTARARSLRRIATFPERLLWSRLKGDQLPGVRFRMQHVVGPYITDFACLEVRLAIELDGHSHDGQAKSDLDRESYLREQGFEILRLGNNEVIGNIGGVLEAIANAVAHRLRTISPPPYPPPARGRGLNRTPMT